METSEITMEIRKVFLDTFSELAGQELNLEKKQEEFENWDSFSHLELVEKVEEKFNLRFDINEVVELNSPQKFIELVSRKNGGF